MGVFNSYVKLPEGKTNVKHTQKKPRTTHSPVQEQKISDDVRLWEKKPTDGEGPVPRAKYFQLPGTSGYCTRLPNCWSYTHYLEINRP